MILAITGPMGVAIGSSPVTHTVPETMKYLRRIPNLRHQQQLSYLRRMPHAPTLRS